MELKWGIFFPVINEAQLLEAKIEWAIRHEFAVSIVEGHHPRYTNVDPNHLSVDGTTEILVSYEDRINYLLLGEVENEAILRDEAYKRLPNDLDVCIMCDADEFYLDKDLEYIDRLYKDNKNLKLTLTNSYIFMDKNYCAPHIQRQQGIVKFNKKIDIHYGQFHERIFRYNRWYGYGISPFLINDFYGRFLFDNPVYFGERVLLNNIHMLHYKNFKLEEAKKRTMMYDKYDDGIEHMEEWDILEKNKIEYKGEHPIEILKLFDE